MEEIEKIGEIFDKFDKATQTSKKMKHLSFEDFLMDYHCRTHPCVLDDDLPDAYDDWLSELDSDEWIGLGDKYLKEQTKQGEKK